MMPIAMLLLLYIPGTRYCIPQRQTYMLRVMVVAVPNQRCALFDDSAHRSGEKETHIKSARALTSTPVAVRLGVRRGPLHVSHHLQGGVFYGLDRYPWESAPMYMLVGAAKLLAIACAVQSGFRVSHMYLGICRMQ